MQEGTLERAAAQGATERLRAARSMAEVEAAVLKGEPYEAHSPELQHEMRDARRRLADNAAAMLRAANTKPELATALLHGVRHEGSSAEVQHEMRAARARPTAARRQAGRSDPRPATPDPWPIARLAGFALARGTSAHRARHGPHGDTRGDEEFVQGRPMRRV